MHIRSQGLNGANPENLSGFNSLVSVHADILGAETRFGSILAICNLLLAAALFAEQMVFGGVVSTLANSQSRAAELDSNRLLAAARRLSPLHPIYVYSAGTLVSLHADRLAHREYQVVRADSFDIF